MRLRKKTLILTDLRLKTLIIAAQIIKSSNNIDVICAKTNITGSDFTNLGYKNWKIIKLTVMEMMLKIKIKIIEEYKGDIEEYDTTGARGSLVSETKDTEANSIKYPNLWKRYEDQMKGAIGILKYIEKNISDQYYIFNGRFASIRIVNDYLKKTNAIIKYYEWARYDSFYLSKYQPHDYNKIAERIIDKYVKLENTKIKKLRHNLIITDNQVNDEIQRKIKNQFSKNYTKNDKEYYDICVFLSSPFEIMFQVDNYIDEQSFVKEVIGKYIGMKICIKAHPNEMNGRDWEASSDKIYDIVKDLKNVTYYKPDSNVNSHDLIKNSKKIIVNYSSMAVDAIFMNNNNVEVYGKSEYFYYIKYLNDFVVPHEWKRVLAALIRLRRDYCVHLIDKRIYAIYKMLWRIELFLNNNYLRKMK